MDGDSRDQPHPENEEITCIELGDQPEDAECQQECACYPQCDAVLAHSGHLHPA